MLTAEGKQCKYIVKPAIRPTSAILQSETTLSATYLSLPHLQENRHFKCALRPGQAASRRDLRKYEHLSSTKSLQC